MITPMVHQQRVLVSDVVSRRRANELPAAEYRDIPVKSPVEISHFLRNIGR